MYKKYYYEEESSEKIVDLISDSLLDDYSEYYTKEDMEIIRNANKGGREGSGLVYNANTYRVSKVAWNSPTDRAGIRVGGIIKGVKYDTEDFVLVAPNGSDEQNLALLIDKIPDNQEFSLLIDYDGKAEVFTTMRAPYTETFVRYYTSEYEYGFREIDGEMQFLKIGENTTYDLQSRTDIAVIDYNNFHALNNGLYGSQGQMERALSQFLADGKTDLILDLRDNGGGFMPILQSVSSHFIGGERNTKQVVSIAKYKGDKEEKYYSERIKYQNYNFDNLVVLANVNTASASEVLIGAMLDYDYENKVKVVLEGSYYKWANFNEDRIEIVKDYRTYGKGIMQTTFDNLLTGEAIKLTTAKIFWPVSKISIHDRGVTSALNTELNFAVPKIIDESESGAVYDAVTLSK